MCVGACVPSVEGMNPKNFFRSPRPGSAFVGLTAVLIVVTGCGVVDDVAHGTSQSSFANAQMLEQDRGETLEWLPDDAQHIVRVASTRSDSTESLVFESERGLSGCETVERQSAPTMVVPGGLDVYAVNDVALCGEWAIAQNDGDFYAWTPAAESGAR